MQFTLVRQMVHIIVFKNCVQCVCTLCSMFLLSYLSSGTAIETRHGLDGSVFESEGGARFFTLIQAGPEANPASCTVGVGSLSMCKMVRTWH